MIHLTRPEIEALRVMLKQWRGESPEEQEFVREQLMALCDTALLGAQGYDGCQHRWLKLNGLDYCDKCGAIA